MASQKQALTAALRTIEQAIYAGLSTIVVGGAVLGATDLAHINWTAVLDAVVFLAIVALGAGLKSYLSFMLKGVPDAYTAPIDAGTATSTTPAVITSVPAAVTDGSDSSGVPPAVEQPAQS